MLPAAMIIDADHVLHGPEVQEAAITCGLGEFFWEHLHTHADLTAQVEQVEGGDEVVMTYAQVLRSARRIACLLAQHGVGVADTVLLACGNSINYLPVMAATQFVGAALAAVDPAAATADLVHLLDVIRPKLCITNVASRPNALAALAMHPDATVVHLALESMPDGHLPDGDLPDFRPAHIGDPASHVAFVMCSSGTSGRPKGVELTSASCLAQIIAQSFLWSKGSKEFQLTVLNLSGPYWVSGLLLQMMCLTAGAKLVLLPDFTAEKYLQYVEKYKVNLSMLSPDKMAALAKHDTKQSYDVGSLRLVTCGGNPVSLLVMKQVQVRLGIDIMPFYALTEATSVVRIPVGLPHRPGSVGVLFPNVQCKTVDPETGATLAAGAEGELCFRTVHVMKGYRRDEAATRAVFDEQGFLHTGDVGYFDAEGYIFIVDRVKELIKYRGNHVPAVELEEVLMTHNDVMDVAVVGFKHAEDWEHATAFVVRRNGSEVTEQQLVDLVKGRLPASKWLYGGVRFVAELPRTATGKVKKRELRGIDAKPALG